MVSGVEITQPSWITPYLQLLDRHALGNYRDLLYEISRNPAMGNYLDIAGNTKANPNENYAREILQLFSIGTTRLNDDGTPQLDGAGQPIPTYTQETVVEFRARLYRMETGDGSVPGSPELHRADDGNRSAARYRREDVAERRRPPRRPEREPGPE